MFLIGFFKDIRDIIEYNKRNDEYYENIRPFDEARRELRKLYKFQRPIACKIHEKKELSLKEKEKMETLERRINILFRRYPTLRRFK